jgi:uncharacterized protein
MPSALDLVRSIYADFGRGDIPAVLGRLADDVEWEYGSGASPVPWLQPRRGRTAVAGFFAALGAIEITRFEPHRLLADAGLVVALINLEFTVRATGRKVVEVDEVHLWHCDADGRVTRFRHRADTWLQAQALLPR